MAKRTHMKSKRAILKEKCLAVAIRDGRTLLCWKSPNHVDSTYESRREHYDPSADMRWTD